MNAYQKRIIAAVVVGIAVVTAVYIPMNKDAVVHTAYATLVLAALISGASLWQLTRIAARDYITSIAFPLALKAYLIATLGMAVLFVLLDLAGIWSIQVKWYLALQTIVIGLTAWKLLALGAGQDAIRQVDEEVQQKVTNWKLVQADAEAVLQSAPSSMRKDISALRDAIRYADPMSKPEVAAQEEELVAGIETLKTLVAENKADDASALCTRLQNVIRDRANRLKILK